MTTFKLKRLSGVGSKTKGGDRLKGDPNLLGRLSFPDGNYLVVTPRGYNSAKLQFLVPSAFLGYTRLAVVRSNYGFPVNKHDGVTVFEYPNTATPVTQTFIDTNFGQGLVQGQWYYYTLFAKMPNSIPNWNMVDTDEVVVTNDYRSGENLWLKLPAFYRNEDANTLQKELPFTNGGQLRRYIDLLGYEIDVIRTEAATLLNVNSPRDMSSALLGLQGYDLSLDDESAVGDARFRSLVDSALSIRERKGTVSGFTEYVRALTDYDSRVLQGRNLLQSTVSTRGTDVAGTLNPTVFNPNEDAFPGWNKAYNTGGGGNDQVAWVLASGVPITAPTTLGYTGKAVYMFQVQRNFGSQPALAIGMIDHSTAYTIADGADNSWTLFSQTSRPAPIPVTGVTYTYSFITVALNPANLVSLNVRFVWLDAQGNFISSDSHAVSLPPALPGPPTVRSAVSNAAPANAAWCSPEILIPTTPSTWTVYFGAQQFELTSGALGTYIDPHTLETQVIAQRVNLVVNPSAEVDNSNWQGTNMSTLLSQVSGQATAGGKVFQITCSASANPTMTTGPGWMTINPAYIHSFRFNAQVTNTSIGVNAIIQWYDNAATPGLIRTDTLNFPAPLPTAVMREYIFGNVVPPSNAANAKVAIQFTGTANGNVILVDSVLFGPGPPLWYFDGDTQDGLDTPVNVTPSQFSDFGWFGTQGKSVSYYYNNYYIAMKRLTTDAVNWIPGGTQVVFFTPIAP